MEKEIFQSDKLSHNGKVYLLSELPTEKIDLTFCEQKILEARISDKSVIQFPVSGLVEMFDRILNVITVITGYDIPKDETKLREDITYQILTFGYKLLNEQEIKLAFRLNGCVECAFVDGTLIPEVTATNNRVNTSFCAKVLSNYMILRNTLDAKLKNFIDGY